MLGKMKGQSASIYSAAEKECKRQFKIDFPISASSIKWGFEHGAGETKVTIEKHEEYEITSGTFVFSQKPCNEAEEKDFGQPAPLKFEGGVALYTWSIWTMH